MVPVRVYRVAILSTRPLLVDKFGRKHGNVIWRWGKIYLFYCIDCHQPVVKGTKEQVKELKAAFRRAIKKNKKDTYAILVTLGNGYQRLLDLDECLFSLEADRLLRRALNVVTPTTRCKFP